MAHSAEQVKSQFVLALGDNFYHRGVQSLDDPLWGSVWQSRFTQASLQTPWYALLGNHDHYGNAQAQIDFSVQGKDMRWVLPNNYYSVVKKFGSPGQEGTLQLVVIDTVILDEDHTRNILVDKIRTGHLPTAALSRFDDTRHIRAGAAKAQMDWLSDVLSTSKADWLLVLGHYPVFSGGEHGNTPSLLEELKPMLEKYRVDAYLCGHDHTAQHLAENGVNYYVVGNGCFLGTVKALPQTQFAAVVGGYGVHQVAKGSLTTTFVNDEGAVIYSHTMYKKPAAAA